jgi:hypothetical protein
MTLRRFWFIACSFRLDVESLGGSLQVWPAQISRLPASPPCPAIPAAAVVSRADDLRLQVT